MMFYLLMNHRLLVGTMTAITGEWMASLTLMMMLMMMMMIYYSILTISRLPDDVLFVDEPQIARWDCDSNNWRMDGFTDFDDDVDDDDDDFITLF